MIQEGKNFIKDKAIVEVQTKSTGVVQKANEIVIDSAESQKTAMDYLAVSKSNIKEIDRIRRIFKAPYEKHIKDNIDDPAKQLKEPFQEAQKILSGKLNAYQDLLEKAKAKEDARIEKKMEKALEEGKALPIVPETHIDTKIKTDHATTSIGDNWQAEVVDPVKAVKAIVDSGRLELLCVHQPSLNKFVKLTKDTVQFDGIKIYNKRSFSSRGK